MSAIYARAYIENLYLYTWPMEENLEEREGES